MRTWTRVAVVPDAHVGPVYGATKCEMKTESSGEGAEKRRLASQVEALLSQSHSIAAGGETLIASWSGDGSVKFWSLPVLLASSQEQEEAGRGAAIVQFRDRMYPIYNAAWDSEHSILACAGEASRSCLVFSNTQDPERRHEITKCPPDLAAGGRDAPLANPLLLLKLETGATSQDQRPNAAL
eukprot:scaffold1006_cov270-Pinguiococcus_pyrenoidosus.AAC.32